MELVTIIYLGHSGQEKGKYEVLGSDRDTKMIFIYQERDIEGVGKVWVRISEMDVDKEYENEFGVSESPLYSYRMSTRPSKDIAYARYLCEKHWRLSHQQ
jgi:hypothetical protein